VGVIRPLFETRTFVGKACVGAQGRALDAARQKSKGKNCLENMNVTRFECETTTP
jgi:hypothetical protein